LEITRSLHDRGVEQVAAQHQEAGIGHQRLVKGRMTSRPDHRAAQFSPMVLPLTVRRPRGCALPISSRPRGHAAGAIIVLAEILAGRLQVDQQWHVVADLLPIVDIELDADVAREGVDMDRRVGRAADRRIDDDGS
jgi:hypothetical protein